MIFEKLARNIALAKEDMASGIFDKMSFGSDTAVLIFRIFLAVIAGFLIAVLMTMYQKRYLGGLVRKLIEVGSNSPENAKTLYEIGYDDKLGVRFSLRYGYTYSKFVVCVEDEENRQEYEAGAKRFEEAHTGEKKPPKYKGEIKKADYDTARFYVPEEIADTAAVKFSAGGANWLGVFIVLLVLACCVGLAVIFLPKILELAGLLLQK